MNATCRIVTIAAMLLHSIFGCSLHHACACDSHVHGEHPHVTDVAAADSCDDDHDCHHEHSGHDEDVCHNEHACDDGHADDDHQIASESLVSNGCDCCEKDPCEHGDSPCCSPVQCSFIIVSDVEFSIDIGPALFVVVDTDPLLAKLPCARSVADGGGLTSGIDDSLSRCALHCSWQI